MPALVTNGQGSANNNPTTGSLDTTGATLLVAVVSYNGTVTGVTDSKGNTWTALTAHANSGVTSRIYYVDSATPTVGSGHTFTLNGTGIAGAINVMAFSGTVASPYDSQQNGSNSASASTIQPGVVTPGAQGAIIISGFTGGNTFGGSATINSGFTITNQKALTGGTNYGTAAAYRIQGDPANPLWTLGSTVSNIASTIAVFKASPSTGFKQATVTSADVPSTQTDFPAYVDLSRLGIRMLAEAHSIRVYADAAKTTEWAREIVSSKEMHVKIPSLTNSVTMYVDWDGSRSDHSTSGTYGRNNVWTGYVGVWHMEELSGNITSSTGNNTATDNNTVGSGAGQMGMGRDFIRASSEYFSIASGSQTGLGITGNSITLSCWAKGDSTLNNAVGRLIWRLGGTGSYGYQLSTSGSSYSPNNAYAISAVGTGGGYDFAFGTAGIATDGVLRHITATYDGTNFRGYVNASKSTSTTKSNHLTNANSQTFTIGASSTPADYYDNVLDEVRIRAVVSSDNWITTEYNNQSDEAGFWGTWTDATVDVAVTPDAVVLTLTIPDATVIGQQNTTIAADVLTLTASIPAATVTGAAVFAADPLVLTLTIPDATVFTPNVTVFPDPLTLTLSIPAATITGASVFAADPLPLTLSIPDVTVVVVAHVTITPDPLILAIVVPDPARVGALWTPIARDENESEWTEIARVGSADDWTKIERVS